MNAKELFDKYADTSTTGRKSLTLRKFTRALAEVISLPVEAEVIKKPAGFPEVICICGSTRFADLHALKRWEFESNGNFICLMINYLPENFIKNLNLKPDHIGEQFNCKEHLDELHLRKIDLADRVLVLNVGGYIGESTMNEIKYALKTGKPVSYLEECEPVSL